MTCSAIFAILTAVDIPCGMTGITIAGSIFINSIDVAGFTFRVDVRASQWKAGRVVIELRGLPRARCMALLTDRAKLTHMRVDLLMA